MKKLYCTHNTAPFVPNGQYCQLQGGAAMIIKIWEYKPQYNRDLGWQVFFLFLAPRNVLTKRGHNTQNRYKTKESKENSYKPVS